MTHTFEILAEAGIRFWDAAVVPVGAATAGVVVSALDLFKAGIQHLRVQNLAALAGWIKRLRSEQSVTATPALPAKIQRRVIEDASFEDDDRMQRLWAQLLVNVQAGVQLDAYLFEILGKLSSEDVQLLERVYEHDRTWHAGFEKFCQMRAGVMLPGTQGLAEYSATTDKLLSLGLVEHVESLHREELQPEMRALIDSELRGVTLTHLGKRFYLAATGPITPPSLPRSE